MIIFIYNIIIYLYYLMKKYTFGFKKFVFIYILSYIYFTENSFAAWEGTVENTEKNTNIILSILSPDLFLNIFFAFIAIVATSFIAKFTTSKLTSYLENSYSWEEWWREELIWVLTRTVNISILWVWFAITLTILWIDMWIFLWGLWFGIGFTLKIFLTNFIAWILMVTQWFYHIWDIIEVSGRTWKIRSIHALFTAIEQFDGVVFYVPNVKFLEEEIVNFHTNDKRRVDVNIGVDYDTDITKAKKIMMNIVTKFPNILKWPAPDILISDMKDSSIELSLRFWINAKDSYVQIESNITETINLAFKKEWIEIPFNQITISNRK